MFALFSVKTLFHFLQGKPLLSRRSRRWASLLLLTSSLMIVGTTAVISYWLVRQIILDSVKTNALLTVEKAGDDIDQWLSTRIAEVETLANQLAIRSMHLEAVIPFLSLEADRLPEYRYLMYAYPDGSHYRTDQGFVRDQKIIDSPYFKKAIAGDVNVSGLVRSTANDPQQVSIAAPIWSVPPLKRTIAKERAELRAENLYAFGLPSDPYQNPKPIGALIGVIPIKHIAEVVATVPKTPDSYAFVLDAKGMPIANPDANRIPQNGSLLKNTDPVWKEIYQTMMHQKQGVQSVKLGEQWMYVAYVPLQKANWSLALVIPKDQVENQLDALNALALVVAGALVIASAIGFQQIRLLEHLEDRVAARTRELAAANQTLQASETQLKQQAHQLEETLQELQQTQSQLVQTEKMSGLGQMVAGVAHEINNPVNFIHANLPYAEQYMQDLIQLLKIYQATYPDPAPAVKAKAAEIDVEFLIEDLTKVLHSMNMGTERIRQLVLSLRNFSRLDEAEMKEVDIHEGLDSTLLILQNRLKAKPGERAIQVIKEYHNPHLVECYAGKLNQVFMNILANAIDALEPSRSMTKPVDMEIGASVLDSDRLDHPTLDGLNFANPESQMWQNPLPYIAHQPTIWIRTSAANNDWVEIRIADNGPGMSAAVCQKIFDPFFTTKTVGKGTGIGLSISYQIIKEHHGGQLACHSVPGEGAEFIVRIPVRQSSEKAQAQDLMRSLDPSHESLQPTDTLNTAPT